MLTGAGVTLISKVFKELGKLAIDISRLEEWGRGKNGFASPLGSVRKRQREAIYTEEGCLGVPSVKQAAKKVVLAHTLRCKKGPLQAGY